MEGALREQRGIYEANLEQTNEKIKRLRASAWHTDTIRKYIAELNSDLRSAL
jgi:hypothetical protein